MTEYTVIDLLKDISSNKLEKDVFDLILSNMDENEALDSLLKIMEENINARD